jgi:hypothetical protein
MSNSGRKTPRKQQRGITHPTQLSTRTQRIARARIIKIPNSETRGTTREEQTLPSDNMTSTYSNADWIGDSFTEQKPTHNFRVAFNNINGIGTAQYTKQIAILANEQISLNIDILGVTEHSLHIHHRDTAKNLQLALRSTITKKMIASNSATTHWHRSDNDWYNYRTN